MSKILSKAPMLAAAAVVGLALVSAARPSLADHWHDGDGWRNDWRHAPHGWRHAEVEHERHHPRAVVVYEAPPRVVYAPPPRVVYAPPPRVVYAAPPVVYADPLPGISLSVRLH